MLAGDRAMARDVAQGVVPGRDLRRLRDPVHLLPRSARPLRKAGPFFNVPCVGYAGDPGWRRKGAEPLREELPMLRTVVLGLPPATAPAAPGLVADRSGQGGGSGSFRVASAP
jgi:hypothetical protein